MTGEEAIKNLKSLVEVRRKYCDMQTMKDEIECLDMAIKALEQEPFDEYGNYKYPSDVELSVPNTATSMPCDEAISRKAVLDLIEHYNSDGLGSVFYGYEEGVKFAGAVNKLPPVNPQPKTGHWIKISPAGIYECSECGQNVMTSDICAYKFCHGCSARMVEPQESEE